MTDAVIQAEYADYKRVKGRKVLQLICEVPIEQAPAVHKMLGEPAFGERQINVAIARLDPTAAKPEPEKPKGKSYAQQAGVCCNEISFRQFLVESQYIRDAETSADAVRRYCMVSSRADLIEGTQAGKYWRKLWLDYQNWLNS